MDYTEPLLQLSSSPGSASAWTTWLASDGTADLPGALGGLQLQWAESNGAIDVSELEVVARRRFEHPDGSAWHHLVGRLGGATVYAQRLERPGSDERGSVALLRGDVAQVWVRNHAPSGSFADLYDRV